MIRPPHGRAAVAVLACWVASATALAADPVERVSVDSAQNEVWVGQRAPFHVILKGKGPFVGAASFSLPRVDRSVLVKVGDAVVSSEEIGDDTWFVQTHEFALFSQAAGQVQVPSFEVRFSSRDGQGGKPQAYAEKTPAVSFEVKQPPNRPDQGYLVTTDKIDVTETWTPEPGPAKQGDVFKRTITQSADQVSGMALAPPVTRAADGIRVYVDPPEVSNKTERGDFIGTRQDTITYVMQQPGTLSIPAVEYRWWNPESEQFGSTTLPAVAFEVQSVVSPQTVKPPPSGMAWGAWLVGLLLVLALGYWQWGRLVATARQVWRRLHPPDRVAARRLRKACRANDAAAALRAWIDWENTRPAAAQTSSAAPLSTELQTATTELQRHLYGGDSSPWRGADLAQAFDRQLQSDKTRNARAEELPPLNPV